MKVQLFTILIYSLFLHSCSSDNSKTELPTEKIIQMEILHYYSIKSVNGQIQKDSLKDCFSCNQATVYDESGKELELRFYQADMQRLFGYEEYLYNTDGQKIGSNYFDKDSLTTNYKYILDSLGRIDIGQAFNAADNSMLYGYQYEYDEMGRQYETGNMDISGNIYEYYRRSYNSNNLVVAENILDTLENTVFSIRYKYRPTADSTWEEQLTYYNDKLSEIRFREKIYFPKYE